MDNSHIVFDKNWFIKYQNKLLWLLNHWLTRRWFRWVLRIGKQDIGYDRKIIQLLPNCYTVFNRWIDNDKVELISDFRTYPKFAKRIYYAFKYVWWTFHAWDKLANLFRHPRWNFGYDTLTVYPAAGSNSPVDGTVGNSSGVSWADCRNAATGNSNDVGSTIEIPSANNEGGGIWSINRGITLFDTSALTSNADISAAVLSLAGTGSAGNNDDSTDMDIVSSSPAANNTISTADYDQFGSTVFASIALSSYSTTDGTYNDFTLDANGIANISKTGISKFGQRIARDTDNSAPTGFNGKGWRSADNAGTTKDPKLVVTYTSTAIKTINGLAIASVKTINGLAIASVKTKNGLA